MRKKGTQVPQALLMLSLLLLGVSGLVAGCGAARQDLLVIAEPLEPAAVDGDQLRPGLAAIYFYDFYRYVSQMPEGDEIMEKGKPGPPILQINHQFGAGNIFASGTHKGVGVLMTGYLHLPQAGQYTFQAESNDGVEVTVGGRVVVSDPGVHKDRTSDRGRITIADGGWFPVQVRYFQRKGTAALKLYWQTPGGSSMAVIPAVAYAHRP